MNLSGSKFSFSSAPNQSCLKKNS